MAVPKAGSWALMIVGFGAMGLAMRRRKSSLRRLHAFGVQDLDRRVEHLALQRTLALRLGYGRAPRSFSQRPCHR